MSRYSNDNKPSRFTFDDNGNAQHKERNDDRYSNSYRANDYSSRAPRKTPFGSNYSNGNGNGYNKYGNGDSHDNGHDAEANGNGSSYYADDKDGAEQKQNHRAVKKNFYNEHPEVAKFTPEELKKLSDEMGMQVEGALVKPVTKFEYAGLPEKLSQAFYTAGFEKPTPIQQYCWPIVMSGKDLVGLAETGSGKTLGFGLPALVHIMGQGKLDLGNYRTCKPVVLVLAPTRELAVQIQEEIQKFSSSVGIKCACVYGGQDKRYQLSKLPNSAIVVATPGRLLDLLSMGKLELTNVSMIVLDEADRMLDMGFEPQIREIFVKINGDRQTLMFSATWPREIRQLANEFLTKPAKITMGTAAANVTVNTRVKHHWYFVQHEEKLSTLVNLFTKFSGKVLIFANRKIDVDNITNGLRKHKIKSIGIHGDKMQYERENALQLFKNNKVFILVATDVAARGLDVKDITQVVNYDFPLDFDTFVHRAGRTARAGKDGDAHHFMTDEDLVKYPTKIRDILRESDQELPKEIEEAIGRHEQYQRHKMAKRGFGRFGGGGWGRDRGYGSGSGSGYGGRGGRGGFRGGFRRY